MHCVADLVNGQARRFEQVSIFIQRIFFQKTMGVFRRVEKVIVASGVAVTGLEISTVIFDIKLIDYLTMGRFSAVQYPLLQWHFPVPGTPGCGNDLPGFV